MISLVRLLSCEFCLFPLLSPMSTQNTVEQSNGDLLTGKLWRSSHPFLPTLPFYSNIASMDDIGEELEGFLSHEWYGALLVVSILAFLSPNLICFNRNLDMD